MDYNQIFAISAAGMNLERTRVEVASMNLANANTLQSADGSGYRPMQVIARSSAPVAGERFASWIGAMDDVDAPAGSSMSVDVVPSEVQPKMVYEPGNPFANEKGFIRYPGVDVATETITMMTAMHSYEANVAAMNVTRNLALKTLDIGG
jgi:flagellar basal-body rod protein FlgC